MANVSAPSAFPPIMGRRKRLANVPRDVRLDVAGWQSDPTFRQLVPIVREYRGRYGTLLRVSTTSVSHASAFDQRYLRGEVTGVRTLLSFAGLPSVSMELLRPPSLSMESVHRFFLYAFLGAKIAAGPESETEAPTESSLIVRPYFTDTLRRAGYLVVDSSINRGVVIDPCVADVQSVLADVAELRCKIDVIIATHVPLDHVSGLLELSQQIKQRFGYQTTLIHPYSDFSSLFAEANALPFAAVTVPVSEGASDILLSTIDLRGNEGSAGSFSISLTAVNDANDRRRKQLVVGLRMKERPDIVAALFSGELCGLDCPGPIRVKGGAAWKAAADQLHRSLVFVMGQLHHTTVVLPAYSGYSNAIHALDLGWAAHWADMRRASAVAFNACTGDSAEKLSEFIRGLLILPIAPLYNTVVKMNREAMMLCSDINCAPAPPAAPPLSVWDASRLALFLASPDGERHKSAIVDPSAVFVLDVRNQVTYYKDYRLRYSVSIPMTFPITSRAAKKAELWTSTQLVPGQRLIVVFGPSEPRLTVECLVERLRLVGIRTDDIVAFVPASVIAANASVFSNVIVKGHCDPEVGLVPTATLYDFDAAYEALRPDPHTIVIDCRSPYEFRNGSHVNSVHLPLTDLRCRLIKTCGNASITGFASVTNAVPDEDLSRYLDTSSDVRSIVLYCAAGYRSHIAMTTIAWVVALQCERQVESSTPTATKVDPKRVCDISKGALQIMTRHAEFWMVKDRNVICIS